LFANTNLLVASPLAGSSPHTSLPSHCCQTTSEKKLPLPVRRAIFSHLSACHPAEPLLSPAGFDYGRNAVDIADGLDISENQ
jgi:hypothetical protein